VGFGAGEGDVQEGAFALFEVGVDGVVGGLGEDVVEGDFAVVEADLEG